MYYHESLYLYCDSNTDCNHMYFIYGYWSQWELSIKVTGTLNFICLGYQVISELGTIKVTGTLIVICLGDKIISDDEFSVTCMYLYGWYT